MRQRRPLVLLPPAPTCAASAATESSAGAAVSRFGCPTGRFVDCCRGLFDRNFFDGDLERGFFDDRFFDGDLERGFLDDGFLDGDLCGNFLDDGFLDGDLCGGFLDHVEFAGLAAQIRHDVGAGGHDRDDAPTLGCLLVQQRGE